MLLPSSKKEGVKWHLTPQPSLSAIIQWMKFEKLGKIHKEFRFTEGVAKAGESKEFAHGHPKIRKERKKNAPSNAFLTMSNV
ncbi:hypothetical protein CDAR_246901 [Caerostris darwini]|uniref:Ribosomal protein S19 n=1 Tax=Caerostris darwini TaxID=1538125 RepID=A0AAV4WXG4_9ARAC|nr:hypothetical protein CDAR_246901 [Caerostris darwini]